jgi:threonine dehydrogenase-like Zn-dependent dehydrogenase
VDRKPLISHQFPLDAAKEAYETQVRAEEAIKVLIKP